MRRVLWPHFLCGIGPKRAGLGLGGFLFLLLFSFFRSLVVVWMLRCCGMGVARNGERGGRRTPQGRRRTWREQREPRGGRRIVCQGRRLDGRGVVG